MRASAEHEPIRSNEPPEPRRRKLRDAKAVKSAYARSSDDRRTVSMLSRNEQQRLEPPIAWLRHAEKRGGLKIVGVAADASDDTKREYGVLRTPSRGTGGGLRDHKIGSEAPTGVNAAHESSAARR
jgi:hypothetical protein